MPLVLEATILPDICDTILDARKKGGMKGDRQKIIAAQCEIIVRALSRVGINALVDEVTGYQEVRDRKLYKKYSTDI